MDDEQKLNETRLSAFKQMHSLGVRVPKERDENGNKRKLLPKKIKKQDVAPGGCYRSPYDSRDIIFEHVRKNIASDCFLAGLNRLSDHRKKQK